MESCPTYLRLMSSLWTTSLIHVHKKDKPPSTYDTEMEIYEWLQQKGMSCISSIRMDILSFNTLKYAKRKCTEWTNFQKHMHIHLAVCLRK